MSTLVNVANMTKSEEVEYKPNFVKTSLPGFMGLEGDPVYIISDARDLDEIDKTEASSVYYVLSNLHEEKSVTETGVAGSKSTKRVKTSQVTLMRRIRSNSGHGLVPVEDPSRVPLAEVKSVAYNNLPKIPRHLMDVIILFFRKVYEDLGTEAIVMLGYDFNYRHTDPDEGWMVFVPEQNNTPASCDYRPESIMEERSLYPDVTMVGTIHSHPMMSAFASATDVADQRDNDGLHITVAWSNNHHVDYHCEYQIGNVRFNRDPEDVIEILSIDEDEDISDWTSQVKKRTPITSTSRNFSSKKTTPSKTTVVGTPSKSKTFDRSHDIVPTSAAGMGVKSMVNAFRSKGVPDLFDNTVVMLVQDEGRDTSCLACGADIRPYKDSRRCNHCLTYLMYPEDDNSLYSIKDKRTTSDGEAFMPDLEFTLKEEELPKKTILGIYRTIDNGIGVKTIYSSTSKLFFTVYKDKHELAVPKKNKNTEVLSVDIPYIFGGLHGLSEEAVDRLDAIMFCTRCTGVIEAYDDNCEKCHAVLDSSYWSEWMEDATTADFVITGVDASNSDDIYSNVDSEGGANCHNCIYNSTVECGPLVDFVSDMTTYQLDIRNHLSGCSDYEPISDL